jgi:hypothetical protein
MGQLGRYPRRGNAKARLTNVIARSEATKQSIFFYRAAMDCFAEPVIGLAEGEARWLAMTALGLFEN